MCTNSGAHTCGSQPTQKAIHLTSIFKKTSTQQCSGAENNKTTYLNCSRQNKKTEQNHFPDSFNMPPPAVFIVIE